MLRPVNLPANFPITYLQFFRISVQPLDCYTSFFGSLFSEFAWIIGGFDAAVKNSLFPFLSVFGQMACLSVEEASVGNRLKVFTA